MCGFRPPRWRHNSIKLPAGGACGGVRLSAPYFMKSRHILATSVVIMLASTEVVTAADKPAKPAAPPKEAPAKAATAKPAPATKAETAKPAPAKPAPADAAPAVEIK